MVLQWNKFLFNLCCIFCFFLILVFSIECMAYLYIYFLPYPLKAEGVDLNILAWESSYSERNVQIPSQGPREGYWGARIGPKKSDPHTYTIEPPIQLDNLLAVDGKGFQIIGDPKTAQYRILILGGSVGFGSYASDIKHTFFSQIYDFLTSKGYSVAIYVLASGSWVSDQEIAALRHYGLKIKPHIVIFVNGLNDLTVGKYENKEASLNTGSFLRNCAIYVKYKIILRAREKINRISNIARLLRIIKSQYSIANNKLMDETVRPRKYDSTDVENYLNNMKTAIILARTSNFRLIFVLQPTLFLKQNTTLLEKRILFYSNGGNKQYSFRTLWRGYEKIRNRLTALSDNQKIYFCDCSNALSGEQKTTFADLWHFSDFGHTLFANCCESTILQVINDIYR